MSEIGTSSRIANVKPVPLAERKFGGDRRVQDKTTAHKKDSKFDSKKSSGREFKGRK